MGRSDHYSRLEFSEGCLHVIRQPSIRIRVHPRLQVEVSPDGRDWTLLDVATRDWVYEALEHLRFLDTGDFAYRSDTWWCVGEEQACFDWALDEQAYRRGWANHCWTRLESCVPDRLRALAPLPVDWFSGLALLQEAPESEDLLAHDPLLFAALARHWEFPAVGREDWNGVRLGLKRKRRHIIEWLGYPASDSLIHGLRRHRIPADYGTSIGRRVRAFLDVATDREIGPEFLRLEHTGSSLIEALADPVARSWITPRSLLEILRANRGEEELAAREIETVTTLVKFGLIEPNADFVGRHRRCLREHRPLRQDVITDVKFSRWLAPIADHVQPLTSAHEVVREAWEMDHCVGCAYYLSLAARGKLAVFRVTAPVRATLALWYEGWRWSLHELAGYGNAEIGPEVRPEIERAFLNIVRWNWPEPVGPYHWVPPRRAHHDC